MLQHSACSLSEMSFLAQRCLQVQFSNSVTDLPKDFQLQLHHISLGLWKIFKVMSLDVHGEPRQYRGLAWSASQQFSNCQVWHYFFTYGVFSYV